MLASGAIEVLEPGFAKLLDMVPPSAGEAVKAAEAAGDESAGVRRAAISRWAPLRRDMGTRGGRRGGRVLIFSLPSSFNH